MLRRTLTYASESGDIPVPITIEAPHQGERDWSCAYEIGWPDSPRHGFGYGIDATQAMLLALKAVGTDLYTSDYHRSGRLRWRARRWLRLSGTEEHSGPARRQRRRVRRMSASHPSTSLRAITCAWISAAPSKMLRMRASQSTRLTGYSSAKPLPP